MVAPSSSRCSCRGPPRRSRLHARPPIAARLTLPVGGRNSLAGARSQPRPRDPRRAARGSSGVTEDCGQYPGTRCSAAGGAKIPADDAGFDLLALEAVKQGRGAAKKFIPGLGHPVHKVPRPAHPRGLIQIATEEGVRGPHLRLFEAIGRVHPAGARPERLPAETAPGVCGAVLADLGPCPLRPCLRGVRAAWPGPRGLLGQLAEEQRIARSRTTSTCTWTENAVSIGPDGKKPPSYRARNETTISRGDDPPYPPMLRRKSASRASVK